MSRKILMVAGMSLAACIVASPSVAKESFACVELTKLKSDSLGDMIGTLRRAKTLSIDGRTAEFDGYGSVFPPLQVTFNLEDTFGLIVMDGGFGIVHTPSCNVGACQDFAPMDQVRAQKGNAVTLDHYVLETGNMTLTLDSVASDDRSLKITHYSCARLPF